MGGGKPKNGERHEKTPHQQLERVFPLLPVLMCASLKEIGDIQCQKTQQWEMLSWCQQPSKARKGVSCADPVDGASVSVLTIHKPRPLWWLASQDNVAKMTKSVVFCTQGTVLTEEQHDSMGTCRTKTINA